jgi:hypothetical protein
MKINKETLWPIDFFTCQVEASEERKYLFDLLDELKKSGWKNVAGEKFNTTVKGYQPDIDILTVDHPMMSSIKSKIIDPISSEFWDSLKKDKINDADNLELIHKAWLVEYENGSYQNLHVHKTSLFTAVWTIYREEQEPGSGQLHLHNPTTQSWTLGFYQQTKKIDAEENEIVVFPAWIPHNLTPCSSKRIVFVWDTIAVPKYA